MLNGLSCSITVYVHSYSRLTFPSWLTSAKQMVLGTRIELVFPPWKGSVLTDRRTEQKLTLQLFKEHVCIIHEPHNLSTTYFVLLLLNDSTFVFKWSRWQDSNLHKTDLQSVAWPFSDTPTWRRVWESNPLTGLIRWQISNLLHYHPAHSPIWRKRWDSNSRTLSNR